MPAPATIHVQALLVVTAFAFHWIGKPSLAVDLLDFSTATVVVPQDLETSEKKAVQLLIDEVSNRTAVELTTSTSADPARPNIVLKRFDHPDSTAAETSATRPDEGFTLRSGRRAGQPVAEVMGNDARGFLFGVGRLLREMRMRSGEILIPSKLNVVSAPSVPLRGHQLGYRPKTNSYDGFTVEMWEQYIKDLVVFGANAIELIPPRSDDLEYSPHFTLPPQEMMVEMSRLAADYGLQLWVWYPALDGDYSDPEVLDQAVRSWSEVLRELPRLDAVFVPGGDPGDTPPELLFRLLERQRRAIRRHHPAAQLWVSPQGFNREWLETFFVLLKEEPPWLDGIVYGPQIRVDLEELSKSVPSRYPIRLYPDITHTMRCQYPVPNWDLAFASTHHREPINPRPQAYARIFRQSIANSRGFITYSEGINDDVNKAVWSALGWNPDTDVMSILRQYGRYFVGPQVAHDFAAGLVSLEDNWRAPLLRNNNVYTTLQKFQRMEKNAAPHVLANWRFQQALYRAYYDAYIRRRLIHETDLEEQALDRLRSVRQLPFLDSNHALLRFSDLELTEQQRRLSVVDDMRDLGQSNVLVALDEAEALLDRSETDRAGEKWRTRVFELGAALYQSGRMQVSVPKYAAKRVTRGAHLDLIDYPLNNRWWLKRQFARLRELESKDEILAGIERILEWENPGPGGYYDDLGSPAGRLRLQVDRSPQEDPSFLHRPRTGFTCAPGRRLSWCRFAETLYDTPLRLRYAALDPEAEYTLRVVYTGDDFEARIRLVADDSFLIHDYISKQFPVRPVEFPIPRRATRDGQLALSWNQIPGGGGNGRGCQVGEVWLIKSPAR